MITESCLESKQANLHQNFYDEDDDEHLKLMNSIIK